MIKLGLNPRDWLRLSNGGDREEGAREAGRGTCEEPNRRRNLVGGGETTAFCV